MTEAAIVQRVWSYCNVLAGRGVSYGDYQEQFREIALELEGEEL